MTKLKLNIPVYVILFLFFTGCRETPVPKPKGYFRIDLPLKDYVKLDHQKNIPEMPFTFEYPAYGNLSFGSEAPEEEGWFNIEFPAYRAVIYLTYKPVKNDFASLMEQTYRMNYKNHILKADAIDVKEFNDESKKVYAVLYDLKGNTATSVQFYATDSVKHYLRGSLYFNAVPDADSLAPVIRFFREDIVHLVETLSWD
ncbi:MAG: gliding motility lipoprotein GldD [Chloroflexota bacterium]